ncbi:MAG: C4-dicarboxylate ABC transporter permease, partial [Treponema sp.]|nr:C4-dicarboxylate ABC transporter permease [Treponema sp.]
MKEKKLLPVLGAVEKGVCVAALVFLVIIAASEVAARFFGASIPASTGLLTHFLLLLGLFSGMFTAGAGEHLSITLFHYV